MRWFQSTADVFRFILSVIFFSSRTSYKTKTQSNKTNIKLKSMVIRDRATKRILHSKTLTNNNSCHRSTSLLRRIDQLRWKEMSKEKKRENSKRKHTFILTPPPPPPPRPRPLPPLAVAAALYGARALLSSTLFNKFDKNGRPFILSYNTFNFQN